MDKIPCPDMLAYPYQINKIVRDMKNLDMPNESASIKRDAIVMALQDICQKINDEFE